MMRLYATYEQAQRRVEILKRVGIWPGIICRSDGQFALTHDPGDDGNDR